MIPPRGDPTRRPLHASKPEGSLVDTRPRVLKTTSDRWRRRAHAAEAANELHHAYLASERRDNQRLLRVIDELTVDRAKWKRIAEYSEDDAAVRLRELRTAIIPEEAHAEELTERMVALYDRAAFDFGVHLDASDADPDGGAPEIGEEHLGA